MLKFKNAKILSFRNDVIIDDQNENENVEEIVEQK